MTRKTFWTLFALAAALRFFLLGRAPLWYDENFTLILARLPFVRMIQATAGDVHPPLWYLIEWSLFHLAPQLPAWASRIPALIFSMLAFVMFVHVCNALYIPSKITVAASVLMALLPMQLWYAQEARMYSMLEFLVLAALWTGLTRKWIWFFLSVLAMLYTQNYGIFYLAVIALILVILDRKSFSSIALASMCAVLLYVPWVFVIAEQMANIKGRYWITDSSVGAVLNSIFKQFWVSAMFQPVTVPAIVITFIALIIGVYAAIRDASIRYYVVIIMAFAPLALAWLVSVAWQPLLLFRPLIGTSPFLYILVAWPVARWTRPERLYAACFAMPLILFGVGGYYIGIPDMKGEGVKSPLLVTMSYIRAHWQAGDVIYYTDDGPMVNLMPYIADLPQFRMPNCAERVGYAPVLGSLSDSTRLALGVSIADLKDMDYRRAWVFAPRTPLHPLCYEDQIKNMTAGTPLITVDENQYITSGVWLVEKQ